MSKRFTFAGLLGTPPKATRATAAETDEDKAIEEDEEDTTAEADEDKAAETEETTTEDDEKDDESPAARRAFRRGRLAERARIGAILDGATTGNVALAAQLACGTDLSPSQAAAVLASAPAASPGASRLAAAMKGRDPAPVATATAAGGGSDVLPDELKAAQARLLAHQKKGR